MSWVLVGASSLLAGNVTAIAEPAPLCLRPMEHGIGAVLRQLSVFRGAPAGRADEPSTPQSFVEVTININRIKNLRFNIYAVRGLRPSLRARRYTVETVLERTRYGNPEKACDAADPTFTSTL